MVASSKKKCTFDQKRFQKSWYSYIKVNNIEIKKESIVVFYALTIKKKKKANNLGILQ
jgi:hypothetical protein